MKVIFLILFTSICMASSPKIDIAEIAFVSKDKITIGDIAKIEGFSPKDSSKIASLVLSGGVSQGEEQTFSRQALQEALRSVLSDIKKNQKMKVTLNLPSQLRIRSQRDQFSEANLRMRLIEEFQKLCTDCRIQIENLQMPPIQADTVEKWSLQTINLKIQKRFHLPIRFETNQKQKIQRLWTKGSIQVFRQLPVVKHDLRRGDILRKTDVEFKEKELRVFHKSVATIDRIRDARLKRDLKKGEILWANDLLRQKALRVGQSVKVHIGNENFRVSLNAIAKESGFVGDRVRVLNPQSNKILFAYVIGDGEVELR